MKKSGDQARLQKQKERREVVKKLLDGDANLSSRQIMKYINENYPHLSVKSHTTIASDILTINQEVDV